MLRQIQRSPKKMDTVADHGTRTSGNTVFLSLPIGKPVEKPIDITDAVTMIPDEIGYYSVDAETIGKATAEDVEVSKGHSWKIPTPQPVRTNIRVSIQKETNKLDVLSDSIGPALLSVLHAYGSMNVSQMLKSLDTTREVLILHLETLERTGLAIVADEQYSISNEGINFLRSLGLTEKSR